MPLGAAVKSVMDAGEALRISWVLTLGNGPDGAVTVRAGRSEHLLAGDR